MARGLVEQILSSACEVPSSIRALFARIHTLVGLKFPQSTNVVGAFYFLRFVGPGLATPELFGLIDSPPTAKSRRSLVLLSKVLQNIANNNEFTDAHLLYLNSIIREHSPHLTKFMDELVVPN